MVFFVMGAAVMFSFVVFSHVMLSSLMFGHMMLSFVMFSLVMLSFVMFSLVMSSLVMFSFVVFTYFDLSGVDRMTVISGVALVWVVTSLYQVCALTICRLKMSLVLGRRFLGSRSRVDSTGAVEADVIINDSPVVDHCTVNIGVVDDRRIHLPNRFIIMKGTALPPAAMETRSIIAEAIVDTAIESNVVTPITAVPDIGTVGKTPVTGSPQVARFRHFNPDARNPEITVVSISPVARGPIISILRARWLFVDDERRRRNCNRDRLSEKRGRYAQQTGE
jgi:hypothetical protein